MGLLMVGLLYGCSQEDPKDKERKEEAKQFEQLYGVGLEGADKEQMQVGNYVTYEGRDYLENEIGQLYYSEPEIYLVNQGLALLYDKQIKKTKVSEKIYQEQYETFRQSYPEIPTGIAKDIVKESFYYPQYVEAYLKDRYAKEIQSKDYQDYVKDSKYVSYLMYKAEADKPKTIKSRLQSIKTEKEAVQAIGYTQDYMYYVSMDNLNNPKRDKDLMDLQGVKQGEIVKRTYKGEGYYVKIMTAPSKVNDYYLLKDYFAERFNKEFAGDQALYKLIADLDKRTDQLELPKKVYEYIAQRGVSRAKQLQENPQANKTPKTLLTAPQYFTERSTNP